MVKGWRSESGQEIFDASEPAEGYECGGLLVVGLVLVMSVLDFAGEVGLADPLSTGTTDDEAVGGAIDEAGGGLLPPPGPPTATLH